MDYSDVTYQPGKVLVVERVGYGIIPCVYGSDTGGCRTLQALQYLYNRFGPVASFSGSYKADSWTLNIERQEAISGKCTYLLIKVSVWLT